MEKKLFNHAMKGEWNEVVKIYKDYPKVHEKKISKSGDTALHLAVSDGQEDYVRLLVAIIYKAGRDVLLVQPPAASNIVEESKGAGGDHPPATAAATKVENQRSAALAALSVENERGNTPLHLAAVLGSVKMCKCIASKYPELIVGRNRDQKTPLFLAAQYGKKDAFLCLHNICGKDMAFSNCRGSNGDTFLHAAINGEYFDLAFQIICRHGEGKLMELFNYYNESGFTPLHVLATKPSSFKSGSRLSHFDKIIYHCTFVNELEENKMEQKKEDNKEEEKKKKEKELELELKLELELEQKLEKKLNHPENYQTCVDIFGLFWTMACVLFTRGENTHGNQADMESQATKDKNTHKDKEVRTENQDTKNKNPKKQCSPESQVQAHDIFPPNSQVWLDALKLIYKAILIILGSGSRDIKKVQDKKQQHIWTLQILNKLLLPNPNQYGYDDNGQKPQDYSGEGTSLLHPEKTASATTQTAKHNPKNEDGETKKTIDPDAHKNETPVLVAAKYGIMEIVNKILEIFPVAIHDMNSDGKNIVLLAIENRQTRVYEFLLERNALKDSIFSKVDKDGNSAVHLAAKIGEYRPWLIPGAALQMQWEIKWYEFVKYSMPLHFFVHYNKNNETPKDIFTKSHAELVKQGGEWLTTTSESCSVVAALIATVAFATASTVPGGNSDSGKPNLESHPAFDIFAISSLVALCFSVTALVMFLAILTSRHQERDFRTNLPRKLLFGLTSLFVSITSMLISFCAGHFFVLKDKLKFVAIPVYAVTCLPVTFFAIAQFPLYFDLMWAMFKNVPQRSYRLVAQDEPTTTTITTTTTTRSSAGKK